MPIKQYLGESQIESNPAGEDALCLSNQEVVKAAVYQKPCKALPSVLSCAVTKQMSVINTKF